MKGLGEMAVIVAVIYVLSCLVGVQGQVGVTICSYRYPYVCPKTVPNSYCNFVTFLCECSKAAGYYPKYDGSRCYYTCGTPAAPENGTVDTSQGTYAGDVATYSCNNGFKVAGDNTTTCVLDAGWNNTATICVKGEIGDDCSLDAFLCENIAFGVCKGTCQCSPGYENDGTSQNCQEIRECASSPCKNGGTCVDGVNNYSCTCVAGYTDKNCTTDIDECENALCQNDGKCVDGINGYTCICAQGYYGINCTDEIHECASSPCKNGGICVDGVNDYSCTCVAGYTDKNCTTDIDECENALCQNDGKCVDEINRYTCICAPGYNGTYCANDKNESGDSSTLPVIILACSLTAVLSIALTLVVLYVVREYMRAKPSTSTPEPAVYYNTATSEYLDDSEVGLHQYERLNEIREREKYYCTLCEISTSR